MKVKHLWIYSILAAVAIFGVSIINKPSLFSAVKYGNWVWEGLSTETKRGVNEGAGDGHVFKELDTGESYTRVGGEWQYINLGLSFIKATKSGLITTDVSGDYVVTFTTPFIDNFYSIALTCSDPGGPPGSIAYYHSQTAFGFSIKTRNFAGAVKGNVTVSWLATRDYNP